MLQSYQHREVPNSPILGRLKLVVGHELEFPGYPSDTSLCVVVIIKEYLERTKHFRKGITSLFVTYVKPYKAATKSTISR